MGAPGLGGDTPQAVAGNAYLFGRSHDVTWKIPKGKSRERIWCPFKGFADGKGLDANLTNAHQASKLNEDMREFFKESPWC